MNLNHLTRVVILLALISALPAPSAGQSKPAAPSNYQYQLNLRQAAFDLFVNGMPTADNDGIQGGSQSGRLNHRLRQGSNVITIRWRSRPEAVRGSGGASIDLEVYLMDPASREKTPVVRETLLPPFDVDAPGESRTEDVTLSFNVPAFPVRYLPWTDPHPPLTDSERNEIIVTVLKLRQAYSDKNLDAIDELCEHKDAHLAAAYGQPMNGGTIRHLTKIMSDPAYAVAPRTASDLVLRQIDDRNLVIVTATSGAAIEAGGSDKWKVKGNPRFSKVDGRWVIVD